MAINLSMFKNRETTEAFPKKYIPNIVETADGYFIEPVDIIITGTMTSYIKFLILDKSFKPIHGHNYAFVKIPPEGYLMRIVLSNKNEIELSEDFVIDYIININDISITSSVQAVIGKGQVESYEDMTTKEIKAFENIQDIYDERLLSLLSNKEEFFNRYLKDVK